MSYNNVEIDSDIYVGESEAMHMMLKNFENQIRKHLKRQGYYLRKSRKRTKWCVDNWDGYRIVDSDGWIVAGEHFELSLNEVQRFAEE